MSEPKTWTKNAAGKRVRLPVDDNDGMCPEYRAISMGVLVLEGRHLFQHPQNHPTAASPLWCIHCGRQPRPAPAPQEKL